MWGHRGGGWPTAEPGTSHPVIGNACFRFDPYWSFVPGVLMSVACVIQGHCSPARRAAISPWTNPPIILFETSANPTKSPQHASHHCPLHSIISAFFFCNDPVVCFGSEANKTLGLLEPTPTPSFCWICSSSVAVPTCELGHERKGQGGHGGLSRSSLVANVRKSPLMTVPF